MQTRPTLKITWKDFLNLLKWTNFEHDRWCWWRFSWAHVIGMWGYVTTGREVVFLSAPWSGEDVALPHQDSTRQPAGLKWKLSQSWGPGLVSSGFYSPCPVQWNLTCFRGELNYGPINKYHISPFEVAYVMESGKMSCVKVITQFLRTNLLCLMFLTFEDCCGFIYSDSSQTERFFSLWPNVRTIFNLPSTLYDPRRGNLAGRGRGVYITGQRLALSVSWQWWIILPAVG